MSNRTSTVHAIRRRGSDPFMSIGPVFRPDPLVAVELDLIDEDCPLFFESDSSARNAEAFFNAIVAAKNSNRFGASVYVYPAKEYESMRLFHTGDYSAGFAIKDDGDLVSVFSTPGKGRYGIAMTLLAIQEGATKLDAFDTILPELYSLAGFVEVGRDTWSDEYMPEGWNKDTFARFNGGEPDVVYMKHDPEYFGSYAKPSSLTA